MTPTPPAVAAPPKLMTVDEFWEFVNLPENADRLFELRRGEVVELSRPKLPHGIVTSNVTTDLNNYARRVRKGFVASNDAGVVLAEQPGTVVGPDVAYFVGVRRFRDVMPKWSDVPPVLAVEVLSPNDRPSEVNEKIEDYLRNGVKVVWLVDYELERVTVYWPGRSHTVLKAGADLSGGDELPGFSCKVGDFFLLPEEEAEAPAA